jgi:hypothetical protein
VAGEKLDPTFFSGRGAALIMVGALALPCAAIGADKERWRKVSGADLYGLFSEKEFGDGVHWVYQFKGDGTFTGTEMSKAVSGSWQVRENEFCWKWLRPPGPEECYEVQQDGNAVRMLINRSEAWYGTLAPLR